MRVKASNTTMSYHNTVRRFHEAPRALRVTVPDEEGMAGAR